MQVFRVFSPDCVSLALTTIAVSDSIKAIKKERKDGGNSRSSEHYGMSNTCQCMPYAHTSVLVEQSTLVRTFQRRVPE